MPLRSVLKLEIKGFIIERAAEAVERLFDSPKLVRPFASLCILTRTHKVWWMSEALECLFEALLSQS